MSNSAFPLSGVGLPLNTLQTAYLGAPTGTSSGAGVMLGLGSAAGLSAVLTPINTGQVYVCITGVVSQTTNKAQLGLRYGTGTPPVNGAAYTGTQVGAVVERQASMPSGSTLPFSLEGIITGLTLGQQIWFDLTQVANGGAGLTQVNYVAVTAYELPSQGGTVAVPAGGTTGQLLTKIDATNFNTQWSDRSGAIIQATPGNPAALVTPTGAGKMVGLAQYITPATTGVLLATISFTMVVTTAGGICWAHLRYGTGTAPANGAASVGAAYGSYNMQFPYISGSPQVCPVTLTGVRNNTVGQQLWFDVCLQNTGVSSNLAANYISISIVEI